MFVGKATAALVAAGFALGGYWHHHHHHHYRHHHPHRHHRRHHTAHHHHRTSGLMRVTNYGPGSGRNADGTRYGGWRVAADWRHYPPGSRIKLFLARRTVIAEVHDSGGAVKGPLHIDAPTRAFSRATGLDSRGTAYVRYEVVYRAPHWNPRHYHH